MKNILIVYHSQSGNTESMARAVAEGAKEAGANVTLKKAAEADTNDLMNCDLLAIGTPNYFSYMAGMVKDFRPGGRRCGGWTKAVFRLRELRGGAAGT
jgi:flavodoxin